jgi:hypothetical protein
MIKFTEKFDKTSFFQKTGNKTGVLKAPYSSHNLTTFLNLRTIQTSSNTGIEV